MQLYLTSSESITFSPVRKIIDYNIIEIDGRHVLEIELEIPMNCKPLGIDKEISNFFLLGRFDLESFKALDKFPIYVYVLTSIKNDKTPSSFQDLQNIAWASLYNNYEEAVNLTFG